MQGIRAAPPWPPHLEWPEILAGAVIRQALADCDDRFFSGPDFAWWCAVAGLDVNAICQLVDAWRQQGRPRPWSVMFEREI